MSAKLDILVKLVDLRKQATEERPHYYTGSVIKDAIIEIMRLRVQLNDATAHPSPAAGRSDGERLRPTIRDFIQKLTTYQLKSDPDGVTDRLLAAIDAQNKGEGT